MDVAAYIGELRTNGELLAAAVGRDGLDRPVACCPGWQMRDLLQHIGMVHRWAAANVARGSGTPMTDDEFKQAVGPFPGDALLTGWFRDGHAALVQALTSTDPAVQCWTFMSAPTPLAFWARRQAHETAIHRVDAESSGQAITPLPAEFAADGIDELLTGFAPRARRRLRADPPRTLAVHATDVSAAAGAAGWFIRVGPQGAETARRAAPVRRAGQEQEQAGRDPQGVQGGHDSAADCVITGGAADLYLLLWNRRAGHAGIDVAGDPSVLAMLREKLQVRWS
jgi:uncharacterized protein (TIGR03083 family)